MMMYSIPKTFRYSYDVRGFSVQISRLQQLFSGIGHTADGAIAAMPLPENMEGWFAIPRWERVAPTYAQAVETVLDVVAATRDPRPDLDNEGAKSLIQTGRSAEFMQKIGRDQKGDILVVPAQFGVHFRGQPARDLDKIFDDDEFGLGVFATGIMLLTHPDRLRLRYDLIVDAAGDEAGDCVLKGSRGVPFWFIESNSALKRDVRWFDDGMKAHGIVSARVPNR